MLHIELLAIFQGLLLSIPLGINSIMVKNDCLIDIKALQDREVYRSQLSVLINEILELSKYFVQCSFHYVSRDGNIVVHKLARNGWNVEELSVWWECIPQSIKASAWVDATFNSIRMN